MEKFLLKSWKNLFNLKIQSNKTKDLFGNIEAGGVLPIETLFTKTDLLFGRCV